MDMQKMMKQAQEMQSKMQKKQEELKDKTVEASAGGGVVTVVVNGGQEVVEIDIDPEVLDPDDIEMLEDLVLAATNEAMNEAKDMMEQEMGQLTGGLNIPGM
ncbi:MAG: YbaB/EbfC family nucleoid-associated protein [Halanaerobacter sp.]